MTEQVKWDRTMISPAKPLLTIVRGCPGAGKSTLARTLASYQDGPVHLEADMFFSRYGEYTFDRDELMRAHRWCLTTTEVMLSTGRNVIVANTFTRYREMSDYVDFAKNHGYGLEVRSLYTSYGSVHGVPEETLKVMRERFESHSAILEQINAHQQ